MAYSVELSHALESLRKNSTTLSSDIEQVAEVLERIKIFSRQPDYVQALSARENITLLVEYGMAGRCNKASREALSCLANILYQNVEARQTLVDLNFGPNLIQLLDYSENQVKFIVYRIFFLLTYETDIDFGNLMDKYDLDGAIVKDLERHLISAESYNEADSLFKDPMEAMALSELLKLLFNVTAKVPAVVPRFNVAIPYVVKLLSCQHSRKLGDDLAWSLVNVLFNLDCTSNSTGVKIDDTVKIILDTLEDNTPNEVSTATNSSIFTAIALLQKHYVDTSQDLKRYMKEHLLPTAAEREKPLGKSDTLFSKLMRLSTSATMLDLRDLISRLMFTLSDNDPSTFVRNVGYGYASGFLMNNKIDTTKIRRDFERNPHVVNADGDEAQRSRDINFVTGQYRKNETFLEDSGSEMTEDEKIREAERLFVLFERLNRTGVVNVENPVQVAAREGRLEELE